MILITEFDPSQLKNAQRSSQMWDTGKSAQNYKLQSVYLRSCIAKEHDKDFFLYSVSQYFLKQQYFPYSYQSKKLFWNDQQPI